MSQQSEISRQSLLQEELRDLLNIAIQIHQTMLVEIQLLRQTNQLLLQQLRVLTDLTSGRKATKMQLQFQGEQPGMPGTETDVQTIPCSALETDAAGNPVTIDPTKVTWTIDDPTIASLTQNADGSATFKALKPGTTNVHAADSGSGLSAQDSLTVTAGAANTMVLKFGTATP